MKTIAKERTTLVWAGKGRNRVKSAPRTKTWYLRVSDELAAREAELARLRAPGGAQGVLRELRAVQEGVAEFARRRGGGGRCGGRVRNQCTVSIDCSHFTPTSTSC